jgi:hypothetical protein
VNDPGALLYLRVVSHLAAAPDLVVRLRAAHVPDAEGLCAAAVCGRPGRGTPHLPWPCPTRVLADRALAVHAARHRDEPDPPDPPGREPGA